MRKAIILALFFSLIVPLVLTAGPASAQLAALNRQASSQQTPAGGEKIAPQVLADLDTLGDGEMVSVIVTLVDQADLRRIPGASRAARLQGVIRALQAKATASQKQIEKLLALREAQGQVSRVDSFWVFNGLAVTATAEVIQELAARADVQAITPDDIQIVPAQAPAPPEQNLSVINAPALWDLGLTGQGVVVANMDSGVDINHPDLSAQWRGGGNSWFDPHGQHPTTPTDLSGHGTWTMGVMVGGEAGGTSVGVAPHAQWIAVKIFNDAGSSTASAIHEGFQWLLDPDDNPATPDAPHVVNNSWTNAYPGCDLEFELDLQSLRAAGILQVFAAGNGGPSPGTSYSPANNPSAYSVGAVDNNDALYGYSSRGPSACDTSTFPDLVAPGVAVHTADLYGSYTDATGTSLAAPHVSGGLALLLSAYPDLGHSEQESALIGSAVDLGAAGADNDFGHGRLDLLAAYEWLNNAPPPTPTPTPTATPTPDPTVNLALNRPVTASSSQDDSHNGTMAADGNLATFWKSRKASGKNKLPSEWIVVDLGSSLSIGQVVLEWGDNYATSYSVEVSQDNAAWTTVVSAAGGNGANDTITFGPASARYVRMDSTAWSSGSLRNWLHEFEIYSGGGGPSPTPTPTPTATPPSPTATPTPTSPPGGGGTMHVGDLDGASSPGNRNRWEATITIAIHDESESPVSGATIDGSWSNGASGGGSCVTDATGACSITKGNIKGNVSSVDFTVDNISRTSMEYQSSANHDPDGDSDGSTIVVMKP